MISTEQRGSIPRGLLAARVGATTIALGFLVFRPASIEAVAQVEIASVVQPFMPLAFLYQYSERLPVLRTCDSECRYQRYPITGISRPKSTVITISISMGASSGKPGG